MKNQDGFTLIETLIAFVILTIALGTLISSVSNMARVHTRAQEQTLLSLESRSVLTRVGRDIALAPGAMDGVFFNDDQWRLEFRVSSSDLDASAGFTLYDVRLVVITGSLSGTVFNTVVPDAI